MRLKAYRKTYYEANHKTLKAQQRYYRLGITQEQFEALLAAQDHKCAICTRVLEPGKKTHVDHDHSCCPSKTKACGACIRGVLCHDCNILLGHAKDSIACLIGAITYLEQHGGQ